MRLVSFKLLFLALPLLLILSVLAVGSLRAEEEQAVSAESRPSATLLLRGTSLELLRKDLDALPEGERERAAAVLSESLPELKALEDRIASKVAELRELTLREDADTDRLPRLGMDLQQLRKQLRQTLAGVNIALLREAGVVVIGNEQPAGRTASPEEKK